MKSFLITLLCLTCSTFSFTQTVIPCYKHGSFNEIQYNTQNQIQTGTLQQKCGENVIQIPVVVHVIHDGVPNTGVGGATLYEDNIPDENIYRQIEQLNKDFRLKNDDVELIVTEFKSFAVDSKIEFVLAQRDPEGNETNGIDRVFYPGFSHTGFASNYEIENVIKPSTVWNPKKYFNIWTVRFTESTEGFALLGYAQFPDSSKLAGMPSDENLQDGNTDGVVINPVVFGVPPEDDTFNNNNRTTTHEVGHWLGLRHIWGDGGCEIDDFVQDTPTASSSTSGCPTDRTTCEQLNMVQNYMDYTNGACQHLFTMGQLARMNQVLILSPRRRELCQSDAINRNTTGVVDTSEKIVKIYPNPTTGNLYIENISDETEIKIYNALGIESKIQEKGNKQYSIENNVSGVYFLQAGNKRAKIILN